jgi:hypothetical protein
VRNVPLFTGPKFAKLALMSALAAGTASMKQNPNKGRMAEHNGRVQDGWYFIAVVRLMGKDHHASTVRRP